jgi:hypothetical protein
MKANMTKIIVEIKVILTLKRKSKNMFKLSSNFLKEKIKEW